MMNINTHINDLWVANWPKTHGDDTLPAAVIDQFARRGVLLDTCLRQMCVAAEPVGSAARRNIPPGLELRFGSDAYRFILEVAAGLRSAVPGETNVFGQLKKAWDLYRIEGDPVPVARVTPWIHRLINDTRNVRQKCLQGIGGASYGTLVRRLIAPRRGECVLFVGAGDLAHSMLPYFENFATGVWNHRSIRDNNALIARCFKPENAHEAAAWADHVIFTTPSDIQNDTLWQSCLDGTRVRTIVHLGHRSGELTKWPTHAQTYDLDDVFNLRRRQAGIRSHQLERARNACRDAASTLYTDREPAPLARLARA
jgi:hypothetical protein